MSNANKASYLVVCLAVSGCAHIDFGGDGLTYYDPKPYLFVSTTKECVTTATVVTIPEAKKVMKFVSGYGSSELSATLSNGMIVSVGQSRHGKVTGTEIAFWELWMTSTSWRARTDQRHFGQTDFTEAVGRPRPRLATHPNP